MYVPFSNKKQNKPRSEAVSLHSSSPHIQKKLNSGYKKISTWSTLKSKLQKNSMKKKASQILGVHTPLTPTYCELVEVLLG